MFKVGDKVTVNQGKSIIGDRYKGVIAVVDMDDQTETYRVKFDDGETLWCYTTDVKLAKYDITNWKEEMGDNNA